MKSSAHHFLLRRYARQNDADQALLLSVLFSIGLMAFRIAYTGSTYYGFLVWNLFLAWVPYGLTANLHKLLPNGGRIWFLISLLCWLLFIPNAFYIITDLFHLRPKEGIPYWYDLALLFSFAWNGLLLGMLSVRQMEQLVEVRAGRSLGWLFLLPVMALNGFGIYIGRYLRFNSWDVIAKPLGLAQDIAYLFVHPLRSRFDWSMIVVYTALMTLLYITIKKLGKLL